MYNELCVEAGNVDDVMEQHASSVYMLLYQRNKKVNNVGFCPIYNVGDS
jgi:hypothetical protein